MMICYFKKKEQVMKKIFLQIFVFFCFGIVNNWVCGILTSLFCWVMDKIINLAGYGESKWWCHFLKLNSAIEQKVPIVISAPLMMSHILLSLVDQISLEKKWPRLV